MKISAIGHSLEYAARPAVCWVLVAAGLLLLIAYPMFLGQVYTDTDLGRYHLPLRHFHAEALARGDSPLWCPYEYSGFYLHGEGQLGLYHPLNWLQYRWLPFTVAFDLEILRNYAFLLVGMYLFLRRRKLPSESALLGSLLFAFSSFNVSYFMHPNFLGIAAHLPWLLLAIDWMLGGASRRTQVSGWVGVILLTASAWLLGHPQATWLCLLLAGFYALFALGSRYGERAGRLRSAAALAAAVIVGCLVAGVQIVPQWETSQASFRAAPPPGFANSLALHPVQAAVQLFAPQVSLPPVPRVKSPSRFLYVGALVPVLIAWGFVRGRRLGSQQFRSFLAFFTLAMLGLALAFGNEAWLYRLQQFLPVVGNFRAPTRYSLFFVFGMAAASAIAHADLVRVSRTRVAEPSGAVGWLVAPLVVSAAVAAMILSGHDAALHVSGQPPWRVVLGPILMGACTLAIAMAARGRPGALWVLPLVVGVGLGLNTWRSVRGDWDPPITPALYASQVPPPLLDPGTRAYLAPESWVMNGIPLASGYVSMPPERRLPIGRPIAATPRGSVPIANALRVASVGWAFGAAVPGALPRARLLSRAAVGTVDQLGRLDVESVALVDRPLSLGGGPAGRANLVEDRPGRIAVETQASTQQLLVLSESFHVGWRAFVDDDSCAVMRVYGDFMGCVVAAGEHRVTFRFDPPSLRTGKRMSLAGLILTALGVGFAFARRRLVESAG